DLVRLYGDLEQRGRYSNNLGYALLIAERHHEALVQFRRAIALRSQPGLGLNLASSLVNLGLVLRLLGDWQGSLETLELAITQCRRTPGQTQMRVCLANFAWVQARGGDFDGALATLAKAEEHAPPAAYRSWRGVLSLNRAEVNWFRGAQADAIAAYQDAIAVGSDLVVADAVPRLALILARMGRSDDARAVLAGHDVDMFAGASEVRRLLALGLLAHHEARESEAASAIQQAATIAADLGSVEVDASVLDVRTFLAEQRGDLAESIRLLRAALDRQDANRARLNAAHLTAARAEQEVWAAVARAEAAESRLDSLSQAHSQLQDGVEARRHALGVIVHDLRNPIMAILGLAELLENELRQRGNVEAADDAAAIAKAADRITDRVSAVLEEETLDARSPSWGAVELGQHCQHIAHDFEARAARKGQRITVGGDSAVLAWVDRQMMREIIENLLVNALKFSAPGATVRLRHERVAKGVAILVEDDGPGFTAADQQSLYRPHARLSAVPSGGEPSTGLGLFAVKQLVDKLRAQIRLDSTPGEGSRFTVTLRAPPTEPGGEQG
ncbi:MAG: signal transduction histidine kinase, partial [Myxococcota bacterium]